VPGHPFEQGFDVRLWPERLTLPLQWRRPRRVFLNSMSDLWHEAVGADLIARVFAVISVAEQHTFQVLTKRPGRMYSLLGDDAFWDQVGTAARGYDPSPEPMAAIEGRFLPNLWLGVSVETQKWVPVRLGKLAATSVAAVRFASCEPLLGELDIRLWLAHGLEWVIAGGESGPGARPMHPDWARSLRDQCLAAGVPFFFSGESTCQSRWLTIRVSLAAGRSITRVAAGWRPASGRREARSGLGHHRDPAR
jgi:protein gp37